MGEHVEVWGQDHYVTLPSLISTRFRILCFVSYLVKTGNRKLLFHPCPNIQSTNFNPNRSSSDIWPSKMEMVFSAFKILLCSATPFSQSIIINSSRETLKMIASKRNHLSTLLYDRCKRNTDPTCPAIALVFLAISIISRSVGYM